MRALAAVAIIAATLPVVAADTVLRNWYDDPFFPVRTAIRDCPQPLGPYADEEQRLRETHYRSERGLRCHLEGKCAKPSAYMYDADIARDVIVRFDKSRKLRDATLWVTVQRRFVWVEGCVASKSAEREIEALLKGTPEVDRVIVFVSHQRGEAPPYRTPAAGQRLEPPPTLR